MAEGGMLLILGNLPTNLICSLQFHDASASLDADKWLNRFFTDDAALQYANNPVISGMEVRKV